MVSDNYHVKNKRKFAQYVYFTLFNSNNKIAATYILKQTADLANF